MRSFSAARVLGAVLFSISLAFTVGGTAYAGPGAIQVSGLLTPDDPGAPQCTDLPGIGLNYVVSGTLTGCWYTTSVTKERVNSAGAYYAAGTETFIGCLGDLCGSLFTTFTFTAKFRADGSEAHGRCHHPFIGGDGDFAGVSGVVNMHDLPNGCATYKGTLRF